MAAALAWGGATMVHAQAVPAADESAAEGSNEIIVTGQKTARSLQDTAASVAVITTETIANQNLIGMYDALERTPNLVVGGRRDTFSIRGIDAFNVSGAGDGALASVYLDGAVMPRAALTGGPFDLYDIAQIEVFRGPQSTVQGRNALAGAVIIRTADPTFEWTGRARLQLTEKDGGRRASAAVGGPLIADQLAFRLTGEIARSDGLVRNVTVGGDADRRPSETIRGKLLLTPGALPALRIVASYMHDRHKRGSVYTELDAPYDPKDRISTEEVPDGQSVKSDIATLDISYDLGDGLKLSSITNYAEVIFRSLTDPDRSAAVTGSSKVYDPDKTFQQELRLNIDRSWVKGLIGAYYLRGDNRDYHFEAIQNLNLTRLGVDRTLLAMGLPQATVNTVLNLYGGVVPIRNTLDRYRLTQNYAGFADLTFPITDKLKVNAGLRYDRESQERGNTQTVVINKELPNPAALPIPALAPIVTQLNALLRATAAGANSAEPIRKITYQAWLPKLAVTYDVTGDLGLTFTVQRGYRAGGSGINQQRALAYDYDPEYTTNYELALRSQWFDRKLTVNANAYWIDWSDQQVSVQLTPGAVFDSQVVNAGKSRLYGFELEVSGRPTPTLNLFAGLGYSNTRFTDFDVKIGNLQAGAEGNEFALAPHWTGSAGIDWQHPSGIRLNLNANYRSAYYQGTVIQVARDIPARTLVNGRFGWQGEHLGAFLIARNIFNVQKVDSVFADFDGKNRGVLIEPRILGLSFEARF